MIWCCGDSSRWLAGRQNCKNCKKLDNSPWKSLQKHLKTRKRVLLQGLLIMLLCALNSCNCSPELAPVWRECVQFVNSAQCTKSHITPFPAYLESENSGPRRLRALKHQSRWYGVSQVANPLCFWTLSLPCPIHLSFEHSSFVFHACFVALWCFVLILALGPKPPAAAAKPQARQGKESPCKFRMQMWGKCIEAYQDISRCFDSSRFEPSTHELHTEICHMTLTKSQIFCVYIERSGKIE